MKVNKNTAIATSKALLVPYEAHHVQQYHSWMQDPDIQEATASEPLTLPEEYENQLSWRTSPDKLTFIICAPYHPPPPSPTIPPGTADADALMRGDINFFLHPYEASSDAEAAAAQAEGWCTGEVDVMLASASHRGQGFGRAAVCALLVYLRRHADEVLAEYARGGGRGGAAVLKGLMVKIKEGNAGSRALFGKLGFVQRGGVNYFGEVVLVLPWEDVVAREWWEAAESDYREVEYEDAPDGV